MAKPVRARLTDADEMRTQDDRLARRRGLQAPVFEPLEALRAAIEARHGPTPHVDPLDGGTEAELLLLLETPGPRGDAPRFVSRDNPTGTARNIRRAMQGASIARERTLLWNVVPWIIHAPGAINRPPRRTEVAAGLELLPAMLYLLPRLRLVILAGRVAAQAEATVTAMRPAAAVLAMPHPSPTIVNTSPAIPARIAKTLRLASGLLGHGREVSPPSAGAGS